MWCHHRALAICHSLKWTAWNLPVLFTRIPEQSHLPWGPCHIMSTGLQQTVIIVQSPWQGGSWKKENTQAPQGGIMRMPLSPLAHDVYMQNTQKQALLWYLVHNTKNKCSSAAHSRNPDWWNKLINNYISTSRITVFTVPPQQAPKPATLCGTFNPVTWLHILTCSKIHAASFSHLVILKTLETQGESHSKFYSNS